MHLERPLRRVRPISLTPLVDVIFLLLLFFMLTSTFTRFAHLEIGAPPGVGGTGAPPEAILSLAGESLRLNGQTLNIEDLTAHGGRLVEETGAESLLVLVRGSTSTQQLVAVLDVLRAVSGLTVTVAR
ncbi:hypothetical protein GCM10011316_35330 [Roseibium aquae]|uniref:Outer membrane transport energization protein ExbD n=1 Tax=Roseibium aquae TaxID=1323746 RepID=A0A916TMT0_9HYPH|nr:biopolymer transporter ExbD [Roseibium aquae]GGB60229.1 hypothetical protein GCM10011316_35330 [Roseibium aquae]